MPTHRRQHLSRQSLLQGTLGRGPLGSTARGNSPRSDGSNSQGLPAIRPVVPGTGRRPVGRTLASLMQTVITAVNARGMCAATAARVAELPAVEVEGIAALCRCPGCLRQQAH